MGPRPDSMEEVNEDRVFYTDEFVRSHPSAHSVRILLGALAPYVVETLFIVI